MRQKIIQAYFWRPKIARLNITDRNYFMYVYYKMVEEK